MKNSVRPIVLALLLVVPSVAGSGSAADLDALMRNFGVTPGGLKPAPAFSLKGLDGSRVSLVDLHGRAVLLYFWATW
jgi:cytochrome c biogenesis protein CcmG, thiol:disulfide interchange protein DsbE